MKEELSPETEILFPEIFIYETSFFMYNDCVYNERKCQNGRQN